MCLKSIIRLSQLKPDIARFNFRLEFVVFRESLTYQTRNKDILLYSHLYPMLNYNTVTYQKHVVILNSISSFGQSRYYKKKNVQYQFPNYITITLI